MTGDDGAIRIWPQNTMDAETISLSFYMESDDDITDLTVTRSKTGVSENIPVTKNVLQAKTPFFSVSRPETAIYEFALEYVTGLQERVIQHEVINALDVLDTHPVTRIRFQMEQEALKHSEIIFMSPVTVSIDEVLVEMLKSFNAAVIMDSLTPASRTCWLSSSLAETPLLFVVDSVVENGITKITIDVWTQLDEIYQAVLQRLTKTKLGAPSKALKNVEVEWAVERSENRYGMICILESKTDPLPDSIYLTLEYRNYVLDTLQISSPGNSVEFSVSFEQEALSLSNSFSPHDSFLTIYITDDFWKSLEKAHIICYNWLDALVNRIDNQLKTHRRFTGINEVATELGLRCNKDSRHRILMTLLELCNTYNLTGCSSHKGSEHCERAKVLSTLMVSFNPSRGFTGYMQIILGENNPLISEMGSERTWRNHLSQIANSSNDFQPVPVKAERKRNSRGRGRPPVQLIPTIPARKLFQVLLEEPGSIVCRYCRFLVK